MESWGPPMSENKTKLVIIIVKMTRLTAKTINYYSLQPCLEHREHLKYFRNVDCVVINHSKVQGTRTNLKTTNLLLLLFAVYFSRTSLAFSL